MSGVNWTTALNENTYVVHISQMKFSRIVIVMVFVLALSEVDHGFEPCLGQSKS